MNSTGNSTKHQSDRNEIILDRYDLLVEDAGMLKSHAIAQLCDEYKLCYSSMYYIVSHKQPKRNYIKKRKQ